MTDWTNGYVADVGYTYGYYTELNPLRSTLAFLNSGLVPPAVGGTHCELGYGQGLSVNIHAAASGTHWYGTDFNPSQAAFAQTLAAASGADLQLYDQDFAHFCSRTDLPEFDSIALHGIWSWISEENRAHIVDFVRRKLKVGGLLYVSYNTQPGWAAHAPLRHLMTEHAGVIGSVGEGTVSRVEAALQFAQKLIGTDPLYAKANTSAGEFLKKIASQDRHYLAHEYFNRDWQPMHFALMARQLKSAKMDYACSAHYMDHLDQININAAQSALLKEIPDPLFAQTVRDFMVNQQFRKDYWVKGVRRMHPLHQREALLQQRVMLTSHRPDIGLTVTGALGEGTLQPDIYGPVLDLLSDHRPRSIGQIDKSLKALGTDRLVQALMVLVGAGHLCAVKDEAVAAQTKAQTDKLNSHLMGLARSGAEIAFLASPVSGGGVAVGRFEQLILLARGQGKKSPQECAQFVWQIVAGQGQRLIKDGKTLQSDEENLAELLAQAQRLKDKRLPILVSLQVV